MYTRRKNLLSASSCWVLVDPFVGTTCASTVSHNYSIFRLGTEVFKQSLYDGVKGMVTHQAYYDTQKFENILKVSLAERLMAKIV